MGGDVAVAEIFLSAVTLVSLISLGLWLVELVAIHRCVHGGGGAVGSVPLLFKET